jgi:serine protease Do
VLVAEVMPESPAAKAGVNVGDVIVEFAGKAVATPQELQAVVEQLPADREQAIALLRDGKRIVIRATPIEASGGAEATAGLPGNPERRNLRLEALGVEVQTLTAELAKRLELKADHGVVITDVRSGSPADRAGLAAGMIILEANRKVVKSAEGLAEALAVKPMAQGAILLVRGSDGNRFVVIRN